MKGKMLKTCLAVLLSALMLFGCITNVFALTNDDNTERLLYSQTFWDVLGEYLNEIGFSFDALDSLPEEYDGYVQELPTGHKITHYKGLKIHFENDSRIIFGLNDMWCTVSEETIGEYVFCNPTFYGVEKNKTGLCLYENGKIYSIAHAVANNLITADELAEILPFTVRADQVTMPPTIPVTQPEPTTQPNTETDCPIIELPEIIIDDTTSTEVGTYVKGDADSDGRVSIKDVTCIQKYLVKLIPPEEINLNAADIKGIGAVTVRDATMIQEKLIGYTCEW